MLYAQDFMETQTKTGKRLTPSVFGGMLHSRHRWFPFRGTTSRTARGRGNVLANRDGSSGVPGGWCWVVRRKLLFSNDLWRKAGHSVYRTQVTEIKRLTMNLRKQPPGTPEEPP